LKIKSIGNICNLIFQFDFPLQSRFSLNLPFFGLGPLSEGLGSEGPLHYPTHNYHQNKKKISVCKYMPKSKRVLALWIPICPGQVPPHPSWFGNKTLKKLSHKKKTDFGAKLT
jgi:hypothetical protein